MSWPRPNASDLSFDPLWMSVRQRNRLDYMAQSKHKIRRDREREKKMKWINYTFWSLFTLNLFIKLLLNCTLIKCNWFFVLFYWATTSWDRKKPICNRHFKMIFSGFLCVWMCVRVFFLGGHKKDVYVHAFAIILIDIYFHSVSFTSSCSKKPFGISY